MEQAFREPTDASALAALTVAERDVLRDNKKKDNKALFYLFQAVHESIFPRIAVATRSKEVWDILKTTYQCMEKVKTTKLQLPRRDSETLCMKESDNIDSFFTHVIELVTQIRSHGETLEERKIAEKVLRSLPSRFDVIVTTIEETKDLSKFTVDELHASLMTHAQTLDRTTNSSLEHAFKAKFPLEEE